MYDFHNKYNPGTSVDLNETMHAMPMSTINHENNVVVLLLVHRSAIKGDRKLFGRFVLYF